MTNIIKDGQWFFVHQDNIAGFMMNSSLSFIDSSGQRYEAYGISRSPLWDLNFAMTSVVLELGTRMVIPDSLVSKTNTICYAHLTILPMGWEGSKWMLMTPAKYMIASKNKVEHQ